MSVRKEFKSFPEIFEYGQSHYPDRTAIIMGEERRTYGELWDRACKIAGYIRSIGLGSGDSVAIISKNHVDYVETVLGCIMAGAVAVKLNWRFAAPELHQLLMFNQVKFIFFRSGDAAIRREMSELTGSLCPSADMERIDMLLEGVEPLTEPVKRGADEILMHLHTSGTTGIPKTVRYISGEYLNELNLCVKALGFHEGMVFQLMSQLFHSACIGTYACLAVGGTVVLFSKFDAEEYLASIEKNRVTRLSAIPTVLTAILNSPNLGNYDLSSVDTISYSTCPMPPGLIRRALETLNCGFQQSYGMTEMGSIVTILTEEDHLKDHMRYLNSVGKPIEGHEVRVVDEQGALCRAGQVGEIVVRGPGMMKDYLKMPEETGRVMQDGWYHTRDIGYLDETGYLYVCGRKNDMIISGGENIFPQEIENVLHTNPGIEEVSILGVPDEYWGEAVHACLVLKQGVTMTGEQVRDFCRGKIAGYKIPKQIHFFSSLPKTATGKVKKAALAEMLGRK